MARGLLWFREKQGREKGVSSTIPRYNLEPLLQKMVSKRCLLKTMKIENGTKNQLFTTVRRWDPLKTVPGSGFEKTRKIYEKTIGKSMVFDGPKPLNNIEKLTLFLILGH